MKKIILVILLLFFVTGYANAGTTETAYKHKMGYDKNYHHTLLKTCYRLGKEKNYKLMVEILLDNKKFTEKSPILLSYLGEACARKGYKAFAIDIFEKVIKLDPVYPKPYYGLGYIYGYSLKNKTKGIKYFQLFIQQAEIYLNNPIYMKVYSPMYFTGSLETNMRRNMEKAKKHVSTLNKL